MALGTYIITTLIVFGLLLAWVGVQFAARAYARRHPEFGPAREDGIGCFFCLCKNRGECPKQQLKAKASNKEQ